jgi:peptide/nickel transport system permease protein
VATDVQMAVSRNEPRVLGRLEDLTRLPLGSLSVLVVLVTAAIFAPVVAPHDPLDVKLTARLLPPVFQGGTWDFPLGTDYAGRDMLSRIVFGARISLGIASASLLIGAAIGTCIGLIAGYSRGRVDAILMRITDLGISYPVILLALVLATAFGPQISNLILALAFTVWSRFAHVIRDEVLVVRELQYVALAQLAGAPPHRIVVRHVLPNVANTIMVLLSLQLGHVIVVEASLSFLGAGVPPPEPAWGSMIALGREYVFEAWWIPTMPGLAMTATVLALNLFGDWLRDRLDPRLRPL